MPFVRIRTDKKMGPVNCNTMFKNLMTAGKKKAWKQQPIKV